jgi:lipooligosaccharide transport system permease protein
VIPFPSFGRQARRIWWRNLLAWKKYGAASTLLNFGEPVFELLAFGFGLGAYVAFDRNGTYLQFLAPGLLAGLAMTSASWDMAFCVHERMHSSGVYEAMVTAPVRAEDVAGGEILWEATRSLFYGTIFLLTLTALGLITSPGALAIPPLLFMIGMIFGPPAMLVALWAKTSEHMFFYFTLCLSPMFFFSGVYFPAERMPGWAKAAVELLPLSHAVRLSRWLATGLPCHASYDGAVLLIWLVAVMPLPVATLRRKLAA